MKTRIAMIGLVSTLPLGVAILVSSAQSRVWLSTSSPNKTYTVQLLNVMSQDPAFPEKDRKVTTVYNDKADTTVVRFGPMHLINFTTGSPHSYAIEDGELRLSAFFTYRGKNFVKPQ